MDIELFNLSIYKHYFCLGLFKLEIGLGDWVGHLFFFEWHEGEIMWDFLFINADKPESVG